MQNFTTYLQSINTFNDSFDGRKLNIITTFNGIGALSESFKQMNIPTDYHTVCEIDESANETYFYNFPENRTKLVKDIRDLENNVQKGLNLDILVQSPPCQSFSMAGRREGLNSENGNLFLTAINLQKKVDANIVIYENVKGLVSHDKSVGVYDSLINGEYSAKKGIGHTLHTIETLLLEDKRYNYYWKIINSADQGLPQNRERIFIVGIKNELDGGFEFPANSSLKYTVEDILEKEVEESFFYLNKSGHKLNPTNQPRRENRIHTLSKYDETMTYESTRRIYAPYVSPCITTGNNAKYMIDGKVRTLTPVESKRVHGFSEEFKFRGSKTQQNKQLGNTVSPGVYVNLFISIFESLSLHTPVNNVEYTPDSRRGRPLKKTVVVNNHITLVKKIVNAPDENYLNLTGERYVEYQIHLDNGGTLSMTIEKYGTLADKKSGNGVLTKTVSIHSLKKLGFRDRKNGIYRVKIGGKSVDEKKTHSIADNSNYEIHNRDCVEVMKEMVDKNMKIPLIVMDPPYEFKNTQTGGKSDLNRSFQKSQTEIKEKQLTEGIDYEIILPLLTKLQDNTNIYIWCNKEQIPKYLEYYVSKLGCSFDLIKWVKTNPVPTFNNKYMSDTEYCLYFRKGGFCNPQSYEDGSTLFTHPINRKDKNLYNHPTIKPIEIIDRLVRNSSKEGDLVFDPFMGSGTTGVSALTHDRRFIGCEIDKEYFHNASLRIKNTLDQPLAA